MLPVWLGGNTARAQSTDIADETIRLAYSASDRCPTASEFEARVRRAAPRARVVEGDVGVRGFSVRIDETAQGRLIITRGDTVLGARAVAATTCDELASILAFAVALATVPASVV